MGLATDNDNQNRRYVMLRVWRELFMQWNMDWKVEWNDDGKVTVVKWNINLSTISKGKAMELHPHSNLKNTA